MHKEIKGLTVKKTKTGADLLIDNSFEGPVVFSQDMGLGFSEPCVEIGREGQRITFKDASKRKYLGKGFSLAVKCECGEILEVDFTNSRKQCWGVCKCGAIFINPFYVDPVSESWQRSADRGETYM